MKDSAGVNRGGHCKDCGVDECSDYKIQKSTDVCRYCRCYPVKHAKDPAEDNANKKQNKDLEGATYNNVNDELVRYSLNSRRAQSALERPTRL